MSIQSDFVDRLRVATGNVISIVEQVESLSAIAMARGYQNWEDEDLAHIILNGQPMTRNDLIEMFQALNSLNSFMDNKPVATANRRQAYNKYRSDA